MKTMIFFILLFTLTHTKAARLTIDVSPYQWDYVYLKEIFGELHLLKNKKDPTQIIQIKRDLKVMKPKEEINQDFMISYCLQLSEDMAIDIDLKNKICTQQFHLEDKVITYVSFPTPRKSEVGGSYYWNSLSMKGADFEKNKKMIISLKKQLEIKND